MCEKYNLTGIVTLETGCGASGRHAIFTSVFAHKKWIENVLDNSAANQKSEMFFILITILNLLK